jgi:hypothetical protein
MQAVDAWLLLADKAGFTKRLQPADVRLLALPPLTLTHWALHVAHDQTVLVIQELHADLGHLQSTGNIRRSVA